MPAPITIFDGGHGADGHFLAKQMPDEAGHRARQPLLAGAALRDIQSKIMRIRSPVIEMPIDVGQYINFDFAWRCAGFDQQLADGTKATIAATHFQHFLISQK